MSMIFLITALLVFPAAVLIVIGDQEYPIEEAKRISLKRLGKTQDRSGLKTRLEELGYSNQRDYEEFRIKQYGFCLASGMLGLLLLITISRSIFIGFFAAVLFSSLMFVIIDRDITKKVKQRRERIEAEFPAVIEMLTLAIAAGETPMSAIHRITQSANGILIREFDLVIEGVRSGLSLNQKLDDMGRRVKSVMIRRFIDALVTATLRGAPIVEVLSRHAVEARENQRNITMTKASKAEISMMIPVVFLILPISIIFALWPSLANLNLFST